MDPADFKRAAGRVFHHQPPVSVAAAGDAGRCRSGGFAARSVVIVWD